MVSIQYFFPYPFFVPWPDRVGSLYLHHKTLVTLHVVEPSPRCNSEGVPAPEDSFCYKVLVALMFFIAEGEDYY